MAVISGNDSDIGYLLAVISVGDEKEPMCAVLVIDREPSLFCS